MRWAFLIAIASRLGSHGVLLIVDDTTADILNQSLVHFLLDIVYGHPNYFVGLSIVSQHHSIQIVNITVVGRTNRRSEGYIEHVLNLIVFEEYLPPIG